MTQLPYNQTRNMGTWNHPTFLHRGSRRQTAAAAQHPPEEQLLGFLNFDIKSRIHTNFAVDYEEFK